MVLSSIGLGTYLGAPDPATDAAYLGAALAYAGAGGNVFDSAANYRGGRSERSLGRAFRHLDRASLFISTKAGYLPMADGERQEQPREWFQRVLAGPGVLTAEQVVDGCHAMTPAYLQHQLGVSLAALAVDRVDLFHLHNPECQRRTLGPAGFRRALGEAFAACEELAAQGRIGAYGCATWNGFRVAADDPEHLSLEEMLVVAEDLAGSGHHLRWIQLPLNLAMPEAWLKPTQVFRGQLLPVLEAARAAGIQVQASASLMQGRILRQVPAGLLAGCRTPAQVALQFARSCPGVAVALCGMRSIGHVDENLQLLELPRAGEEELRALVGSGQERH